ncbi:FAD-dependent oxidoreductase [Phenylobacterium deserti]|uniref:FAD-dependent oxidoreductase n=1 Tax=Phenylobacterium deserti TaxID=1914756 RepID=UPI001F0C7EEE|nr:FAD-dependent oxidoreductase [Phenylobacterium deserti]
MNKPVIALTERRAFLRTAAAAGGLSALGLAGCATTQASPAAPVLAKPGFRPVPPLGALLAKPDRIMGITVCLRPFRAAGPRLDTEKVGDKLVVHNYGHGGSGWSLSWGSANVVVKKALSGGEKDVAIIGCGALGLTAAITAQRAGARVTIYAKERMPEVRSARATGVWSPDSRIALASAASPDFPALWEEMCRASFRTYQSYLGLPGSPIEWTDRYILRDNPPPTSPATDPMGFAHYESRVHDLLPRSETLPPQAHPFPAPYARRLSLPMFNVQAFGRLLMSEFLLAGGRIETVEFNAPADLARLKEKVVINCTGYGARALWKDETVVPVRGQIAWLIPQAEVNYGLVYKGVSMLGRRDGIVIQKNGADESWGYNDANETPDRAEAEAALATIASLYPQVPV